MKRILIADDEKNMIWALKKALKDENYRIITASDGLEAYNMAASEEPDLMLLDLRMPKMDGLEVLKKLKEDDRSIPVVMITAHGTMESAIDAMKLGAIDYISKPFDIEELKLVINKALNIGIMQEQIEYLTEELTRNTGNVIIGESEKIKEVLNIVSRVASSNATVIITGESGTGKEVIANSIHFNSNRRNKPYVKINCGAIPENLLESELFGYEKGAFTGAISRKPGKFELADGGTIFLDEVGELNTDIQVKLLRAIQEREFERIGGVETIKVDVRIIAATNRNLKEMVDSGEFREDLYYRLNVIAIELPLLRERKKVIPMLIEFFTEKFCREIGRERLNYDEESMNILINYEWKGNIRELENVVERLAILNQENRVKKEMLPREILYSGNHDNQFELPDEGINLDEVEKSFIIQALEKTDYNQTHAARILGITRHTLLYRMEKHRIKNRD